MKRSLARRWLALLSVVLFALCATDARVGAWPGSGWYGGQPGPTSGLGPAPATQFGGVDPTGVQDSTTGIGNAVAWSGQYGQPVVFTPGIYKVTGSIGWPPRSRITINPGVVFTGSGNAYTNLVCLGTPGLPQYPVCDPKIWFVGDSQTLGIDGAYNGLVGGYPSYAVQDLRQWRGDFEVIASQVALPELAAGSSIVWNEGHTGQQIATIAGNLSTWAAATAMGGTPDVAVVMAGANDFANGRTAAQAETDWGTLYTDLLAINSNMLVVEMPCPPFVAGTTVGANLATWNTQQAAFNTWMQGTHAPANSTNALYSSCSQVLTPGDRLPDGVHQNLQGQGTQGHCVANVLDETFGYRRQPRQFDRFRYRNPWGSEQATANGNSLTVASHPGFNPGTGSFTIAFDIQPTSLPLDGTSRDMVSYGSSGTNNWWGVLSVNGTACTYWETSTATICGSTATTFAQQNSLIVGQTSRIVVMADAAHGVVGEYVNAKLAGLATGLSAWSNTQQTTYVGAGANFGAQLGYYGRVWAAKAVPAEPGSVAALEAVERDYYLGASIVPGASTASYSFDGVLSDDVYAPGDPNPTFSGSLSTIPAYPTGTPLRPWESAGAAAPPPFASAIKSSDQSVTSTTPAAETDMQVTMNANDQWIVSWDIYVTYAGSGAGMRVGVSTPTGATLQWQSLNISTAIAAGIADSAQGATSGTGVQILTGGSSGTSGTVRMAASVKGDGTHSGNIALVFGESDSGTNSTVKAGSTMKAQRVTP